ncbi:hypothetical protein NQ315_010115 [Exocentrus adspersus]|uniref:Secreted protein n=1 Tax=Exocentrus adspersus TaxID=1586481 RepID=A0AAV8WAC3_9CUCU|nr:hypothetical protein NQ315_010115 [Exocentrus adspersus]
MQNYAVLSLVFGIVAVILTCSTSKASVISCPLAPSKNKPTQLLDNYASPSNKPFWQTGRTEHELERQEAGCGPCVSEIRKEIWIISSYCNA